MAEEKDTTGIGSEQSDVAKALADAFLSRATPPVDEETEAALATMEPPATDEGQPLETKPPAEASTEPPAGEEPSDEMPEGVSSERARTRFQELANKTKAAEQRAAEAEATARWLLTPEGRAWTERSLGGGQPAAGKPGAGDKAIDFSNLSDAEIVEEMLSRTAQQTEAIVSRKLAVQGAMQDLASRFPDFNPQRDGPKVRRVLDSGAVDNLDGAYYAAFPERVQERAAHVKRAEQSRRTTGPSRGRTTPEPDPQKEAQERFAQTVAAARRGERGAFRELLGAQLKGMFANRRGRE